jgi:hypothetical protein
VLTILAKFSVFVFGAKNFGICIQHEKGKGADFKKIQEKMSCSFSLPARASTPSNLS